MNLLKMRATRPQLGVGMDMPWGTNQGFMCSPNGDSVTPNVRAYFQRYGQRFHHVFLAFQPKNRRPLRAEDYYTAYSDFFEAAGHISQRALHHTMLNLAGEIEYSRERLLDFTNSLIYRFGFEWVNEDVGIWSSRGKAMPYPLPPILNERSLNATISATLSTKSRLSVPLVLEFPGFTEGSAIIIGEMHAFDYFKQLSEATDCPVTLDTGHIISYQYLTGKRGKELYSELDRLPLNNCFEIHLAGSELTANTFRDMHHGILLDEQLQLLKILIDSCPYLHAVTYEDPRPGSDGFIADAALSGFEQLRAIVEAQPTLAGGR